MTEERAETEDQLQTMAIRPDIVEPEEPGEVDEGNEEPISEPTKLIRIASMTRAMLEEVRQAELDEDGRKRLAEIHQQSLRDLRDVLSPELTEEFDGIFKPLTEGGVPSDSVIRIAQAQLIGWLEGLFHGIQATLFSQQMAAQAQLAEMQRRAALNPPQKQRDESTGLYL